MEGPSVSKSFMRDLKLMDKRLGIKFNGEHHVITYLRPQGDAVNVYRVKADNGGYRDPDTRDLIALRKGDLSAEGVKSRLQKLAAYSENIREKAKADAYDNVRAMTRDSRVQLANAAIQLTNQGKGNSAHRRIAPKPSKNVVKVIP
jgi:hypothetical protein